MAFVRAERKRAKLRMAIYGPSGGGKTYTALKIAHGIGPKIAVLDCENGTSQKYAPSDDGPGILGGDYFDIEVPDNFEAKVFVDAIATAAEDGYDVLIIDGFSHAWSGRGGVLDYVDKLAKQSRSGSTFDAWREGTKKHNEILHAIVHAKLHIICTMRSKNDTVMETNARGKQAPKKVGVKADQREGMEYEFDVVGLMNLQNEMIIEKSRYSPIHQQEFDKPDERFGRTLLAWLNGGAATTAPKGDEPKPPVAWSQGERAAFIALAQKLGAKDAPQIQALAHSIDPGFLLPLNVEQTPRAIAELTRRLTEKTRTEEAAAAPPETAPPPGEASGATPAPTKDTSGAPSSPGSAATTSSAAGEAPPATSSPSSSSPPAPAADAPRPGGGAADSVTLLRYVDALDTCTDVEQLNLVENSHAEAIASLKHGKSLAGRYARQTALRLGVPDVPPLTDVELASLVKLADMRRASSVPAA